jgi:hypothetical protein
MTYTTRSISASGQKPFDKRNAGVLFKNTRKENEQHSDYSGELDIHGTKFWLNGWVRVSKAGTKFLSISLKPKGDAAAKKVDFNDEVPF